MENKYSEARVSRLVRDEDLEKVISLNDRLTWKGSIEWFCAYTKNRKNREILSLTDLMSYAENRNYSKDLIKSILKDRGIPLDEISNEFPNPCNKNYEKVEKSRTWRVKETTITSFATFHANQSFNRIIATIESFFKSNSDLEKVRGHQLSLYFRENDMDYNRAARSIMTDLYGVQSKKHQYINPYYQAENVENAEKVNKKVAA